jgi:hypothetical protein
VDVVAALHAADQPRSGGHAGVSGAQNQDPFIVLPFVSAVDTHETQVGPGFVTSTRGAYAALGLYQAWCAFATLLSTRIWQLNSRG